MWDIKVKTQTSWELKEVKYIKGLFKCLAYNKLSTNISHNKHIYIIYRYEIHKIYINFIWNIKERLVSYFSFFTNTSNSW